MKTRNRGFTLLELMVVIVVASILLGVAVPALGDWIRNARLTSAANDLVASLHYARSESIKRRLPVVFCASANAIDTALPDCSGSAELTGTGWIVFVDGNRNGDVDGPSFDDVNGNGVQDPAEDTNGNGELDPGEDIDGDGVLDPAELPIPAEEVIQRHDAVHPSLVAAEVDGLPLLVTYLDTGFPASGTGFAIVACDSRGNRSAGGNLSTARAITLSPLGRPAVTRDKAEITAIGDCP